MESKRNLLEHLPVSLSKKIIEFAKIIQDAGYPCYLIGGAVRDLLMSKTLKDVDFTTKATPEVIMKLFPRVIPTGIKHGTVTVLYQNESFEITTFRAESTYSDGRRPDSIQYSETLEEDLGRRDFTMNAIAYDPVSGELTDLFNGKKDIQNRIIRTIGNPLDRFREDSLRTVRACRFSASPGFQIHPETLSALSNRDILDRTRHLAIERFTDELLKGFRAPGVSRMIAPLQNTGLLNAFLRDFPIQQIEDEEFLLLDESKESCVELRLSLFFYFLCRDKSPVQNHRVRKKQIKGLFRCPGELSRILKLSNQKAQWIEGYFFYISIHMQSEMQFFMEGPESYKTRQLASMLKQHLKKETQSFLENISNMSWNRAFSPEPLLESLKNDPLVVADLDLDGNTLQQMGIHGKTIGEVMNLLLDQVLLDPSKNSREILVSRVQEGLHSLD